MASITRRTLGVAAALLLPGGAGAQGCPPVWSPDRPLRWLVGYPASGGTDVLARLLGNGAARAG